MKLAGATTVEWRDVSNNSVVSTTSDLTNIRSGSYQLFATNANFGCTASSSIYHVGITSPLNVQLQSQKVLDASCGLNNGSIDLTISNASSFQFQWLKDSLTDVGSTLSIKDLPPATYFCIATDQNGCTQNFYKKQITALPLPKLDETTVVISSDTCELSAGGISGLKPVPDQPGISYSWFDNSGAQVGNQISLKQVRTGTYQLKMTDSHGCSFTSRTYHIDAVSIQLVTPLYNASQIDIPRNADANLKIQNPRSGSYELFDASTGNVLQQNSNGNFTIPKVGNDLAVQVRYTSGTCSSGLATITIKVFDDTRLSIPNAFSPNHDGINDLFRITVQGYFRLSYVKIFNRWGEQVFESRDLNLSWDGSKNGTDLPTGTYYWVLEGLDVHNTQLKRSGSITLIR
jgi:gliding motility-associated-like protein